MIPLAIRRHHLQDLTLGQSVVLTVPHCEERQIRQTVADITTTTTTEKTGGVSNGNSWSE
ncbi:MAG: hypothetical protein ACK6EB_20960 [Planctomyces sp.]|jgi:hypothetical protein